MPQDPITSLTMASPSIEQWYNLMLVRRAYLEYLHDRHQENSDDSARLLRIRQMAEATLHEHQSRLLGVLTITAAQRFGAETSLIKKDGGVRRMRMASISDVVLLDHPADAAGPRSIDCYLVKTLDLISAASGGADPKRLKVGPDRLLYSLRWKHNATRGDLHLRLVKDPDLWFECIANLLLEALAQHDPGLRERLQAAAAAKAGAPATSPRPRRRGASTVACAALSYRDVGKHTSQAR